jgi:hypothetical protein
MACWAEGEACGGEDRSVVAATTGLAGTGGAAATDATGAGALGDAGAGEASGTPDATRSTRLGGSGVWTELVINKPPPNPTPIATNTVPMPAK